MKKIATFLCSFFLLAQMFGQVFSDVTMESDITDVQPMTGIVLWTTNPAKNTDVISLEYSYMLYNQVVTDENVYDWSAVDDLLEAVASRGHQAILRFRFVYVGYQTSVPDYIKNLSDYHETEGLSEGVTTWFPDWTHPKLKDFTLQFYTKFAERYDDDPRLAFVQTGFGLWAEYHIYDGPFVLGQTFPSKAFQAEFLTHLDSVFVNTPWSISIDAADDTYSPFDVQPNLLNLQFGNFDDSFMAQEHPYVNELNWDFFGAERYKTSPAGGEFSYYTDWDQEHVLDWPNGAHGISYEDFASKFLISYIIGNDQPEYQSMERIKEASLASGYKFWVKSFKVAPDSAIIEIKNVGVGSFYYDAFPAVNGIRASESLKYLGKGESRVFHVGSGGDNPTLTIECDRLVPGQKIDFYGTTYVPVGIDELAQKGNSFKVFPNILKNGDVVAVELDKVPNDKLRLELFGANGQFVQSQSVDGRFNKLKINQLQSGTYFLLLQNAHDILGVQRIVVQP